MNRVNLEFFDFVLGMKEHFKLGTGYESPGVDVENSPISVRTTTTAMPHKEVGL